jgi:hypothetical protein
MTRKIGAIVWIGVESLQRYIVTAGEESTKKKLRC